MEIKVGSVLRKTYTDLIVKEIDPEKWIIEAEVSTSAIDRDREIIRPEAWSKRLKEYKKHPIVLASHDYWGLSSIIGKTLKVSVTDTGLLARMQYLVEENELAQFGFRLAEQGLGAWSVGFMVFGFEDGDQEDSKSPRRTFTDVELLEISQVSVPSNRDAVLRMQGKYTDWSDPAKQMLGAVLKRFEEKQSEEPIVPLEQGAVKEEQVKELAEAIAEEIVPDLVAAMHQEFVEEKTELVEAVKEMADEIVEAVEVAVNGNGDAPKTNSSSTQQTTQQPTQMTTDQAVAMMKELLPSAVDKAIRKARGEVVDE